MGPDTFSPDMHFAISMVLTFGCLLGFAIRELLLLRRGTGRPDEGEVTPTPLLPVDSAPPPGQLPPTLHPLTGPARTTRRRVREPA